MDLFQPDEKGLFTFYREQDQLQQRIKKGLLDRERNKVHQSGQFRKDQEKMNRKNNRKAIVRCNNENNRSSTIVLSKKNEENRKIKTSQKMSKIDASLKHNKLNRNHKLLKMALKDDQEQRQNAKHLKTNLKQLLKTQRSDTLISKQTRVEDIDKLTKEKITIDNISILNQILKNSKQTNQSVSLNILNKENSFKKQYNNLTNKKQHILKELSLPKLIEVKHTNLDGKNHRLNKKSYSQKLKNINNIDQIQLRVNISQKTRYISPNIKVQQQKYLEPIRSDRKQKNSYALNLQCFNPHRKSSKQTSNTQTIFPLLLERQKSEQQFLMRNLVKNIKFK